MNNVTTEQFEFKAEMKQLLHLIIHSLYTHPDVFLRELISNSSDALNKFRFERLTNPNVLNPDQELCIRITTDKETNTISIEDFGVGLTKEDLINKLGSVASSGTLEFLQNLKEQGKNLDNGDLIGQFGVGFYSVFMVTDEVTLDTKFYQEGSESYQWISNGEGSYSIGTSDREVRGTKITFTLKEEYKNLVEDYKLKSIIEKYSNFVEFPIYVNDTQVNKVTALWQRSAESVTEEERNEFYKFLTHDYEDPMGYIHFAVEGVIECKSILFFPATAPTNFLREEDQKSVNLYSNKVLIQENCKELLPDYLRFIRGVVDTPDLPLNVSREITQSSPVMAKIKTILVGKILTLLEDWAANEPSKYEKFLKNFGQLFKLGINSDFTNKDRLTHLLRYESTRTEKGVLTSLKDYISRMDSDQNSIYYVSGDSRENLFNSPKLEYFKKQNIEVLLLTDPSDIFTVPYIFEYEGKKLESIEKAEIKHDDSKKSSEENSISEQQQQDVIAKFKSVLTDKVEDVVVSMRLVNSPATLVQGKDGMDTHTERLMKMMDKNFTGTKRVLEINTSHPLIKNISTLLEDSSNDEFASKSIQHLYESCLLLEGMLNDPNEYFQRMSELLTKATTK